MTRPYEPIGIRQTNSDTVVIDRTRAERIWVFLSEFADYGYRFGLPNDLRELVSDCLSGEDTHRSAWGLDERTSPAVVRVFGPEGSHEIAL